MVVSAEKARQKAEARRLRILAKSAERMDVVSGLAPSESVAPHDATSSDDANATNTIPSPSTEDKVDKENDPPNEDGIATDRNGAEGETMTQSASSPTASGAVESPRERKDKEQGGGAGARRMAAMRRRRYQKSAKAQEGEGAEECSSGEKQSSEKVEETKVKEEPVASVAESVPSAPESASAESHSVKKEIEATSAEIPTKTEQAEVAVEPAETHADEKKEDPSEEPKKYMGVARMRRKMLKEQKAQRIKDISDGSIDTSIADEVATMNVTASMIRKGSIDEDTFGSLSVDSLTKKARKKWFMALLPPMHILPRLVTLVLLFVAGLDLGLEPYRRSLEACLDKGLDTAAPQSLLEASPLIKHVETSLTKPWEYGMGGKVAYMIGHAPTSPPSALPTSLSGVGQCVGDQAEGECLNEAFDLSEKSGDHSGSSGFFKRLGHVFHGSGDHSTSTITATSTVFSMEDEFDSHRPTISVGENGNIRPRGVSHDGSEFDEEYVSDQKHENIDPLFQVDLDRLLINAELPFPLDTAARLAIGFHRTWVYYLWTLPISSIRWFMKIPKDIVSGWISNPPVVFLLSLFVRLMCMVLLGTGESGQDEDPLDKSSGGSGKMDILGKVVESAKKYVGSTFPKMFFVLGMLRDILRVDMYIVLCGYLVGLVVPDALNSHGFNIAFLIGGNVNSISLGEGEL